jgi:hypothetical protein
MIASSHNGVHQQKQTLGNDTTIIQWQEKVGGGWVRRAPEGSII